MTSVQNIWQRGGTVAESTNNAIHAIHTCTSEDCLMLGTDMQPHLSLYVGVRAGGH